jgi:upstream activation factor subunit UAF30
VHYTYNKNTRLLSTTTTAIMPSSKVSKTTTAKVTKTKTASKTLEPKPTPTVAATGTPPNTQPAPSSSAVELQIDVIQQEIIAFSAQLRSLTTKLKQVKKDYAKEVKQLQKKKKSGGSGIKHQSGIAKPGFISPELCNFIGVTKGTELARTEVIKYVNKYIKENQLQDQNNKKVILPDAKLQTLLQSTTDDEITYFNLQTFMKPHYVNPAKNVPTSTVA